METDLSKYDNAWFDTGAGRLKRFAWYIANAIFFHSHALLPYGWKSALLRAFGAKVGRGVVIKPWVNIKYPWKLVIGDHVWLGERCWIDNLDLVVLEDHVCISQGALILSGNHDYTSPSFDLMVKPIKIEKGAWIGAKAMVVQGVTVGAHAVLTAGSIATKDLDPFGIYSGNPAELKKQRTIKS